MGERMITLTPEGITSGTDEYLRLEVAARRVGLHPQSLNRLYRNSGIAEDDRQGLKIGGMLFFNEAHMESLGYPLSNE